MAGAIVQEKQNDIGGSGGTTMTVTPDSNVTAGNLIHVAITYDYSLGQSDSVTDNLSNTYTQINAVNDTTHTQRIVSYYAKNINGGAATITLNTPNSNTFRGIVIREISGCDTASPLDGNNINWQATPGTGTDALVSGNDTNTVTAFMSAGSVRTSGAGAPTAGTGFTSSALAFFTSAAGGGRLESKASVSVATQQATLTAAANIDHITWMAMFKEAAAGGATRAYLYHQPKTLLFID